MYHYHVYLLIIFVIVLIFYNVYSFFCNSYNGINGEKMLDIKEGMSNENNAEISVLTYKNAGAIENLQKEKSDFKNDIKQVYQNQAGINELNIQVSKLVQQAKLAETTNNNQDMLINKLTSQEKELREYTTKAYTTSQENKQRFVELANESKKASDEAQQESDGISFEK